MQDGTPWLPTAVNPAGKNSQATDSHSLPTFKTNPKTSPLPYLECSSFGTSHYMVQLGLKIDLNPRLLVPALNLLGLPNLVLVLSEVACSLTLTFNYLFFELK